MISAKLQLTYTKQISDMYFQNNILMLNWNEFFECTFETIFKSILFIQYQPVRTIKWIKANYSIVFC